MRSLGRKLRFSDNSQLFTAKTKFLRFDDHVARDEIRNAPFRCNRTSVILLRLATAWTKLIWNSYKVASPILKLSCTIFYADVVLFTSNSNFHWSVLHFFSCKTTNLQFWPSFYLKISFKFKIGVILIENFLIIFTTNISTVCNIIYLLKNLTYKKIFKI